MKRQDAREAYNALMKFYPLTLDDIDGEEWRDIEGYDGKYQISNFGRVKSLCWGKERIFTPQLKNYLSVNFHVGSKLVTRSIQRLVAEAFIQNPNNKPQVNHIDGNRFNNHFSNLEWVTSKENIRHAHSTGLVVHPKGENGYKASLTNEQAKYIRDNPNKLMGKELAAMFGVSRSIVSLIRLGKTYKVNEGGD